MALSLDQTEFFAENGYLPYGPLLAAEEIEALRSEYDRVFAEARESGALRNLAVPESGAEPRQMLQIMQMCERSLAFRRLLYDPRILDAVESLIGPNVMLFHDQALYKPARTGGPIFWHQDNAYWRCSPANLVSCWLTLNDAVRENGAMQVVPGSHRRLREHRPETQGGPLLESSPGEAEPVVIELPAGGCMFHHCLTLHATEPNTTEQQRRAFAIHFMSPGTRDRSGAMMHVDFHRPLLRACW